MTDVSTILERIGAGDPNAAAELLPLVYDELRKLAAARLAHERPGQTLDATGLVHEAYLRLVASPKASAADEQGPATQPRSPRFDHRGHFFGAAADAMRRILMENARRKKRLRHGGDRRRVDMPEYDLAATAVDDELLALDEALTRLADEDAVAAQIVNLRHFAGLGHEGVAATLQITVYQARQKWTYARAWLRQALSDDR